MRPQSPVGPVPWLLGPTGLLLVLLLPLGLVAESLRQLEVSENAPPGSRVGFIDANGSPPYLIVPVPGSAVESDLSVDQTTGEIRTRSCLDRESRPSYSLVALPQNVRVVVRVLDENDNAPSFLAERVLLDFPENAPRDSRRALPPARDPDLGVYSTQTYEIVAGNEGGAFKLAVHRGRDGVLYLDLQNVLLLDRESRAEYSLVIEARDGGSPPLRSKLQVDVRVQDVNDNPPVFSADGRYEVSVPENASVGTSVVQVHADDADEAENGRIEYFINRRQSDREELFRVESDSGWIYVNKPLDFEARERHELVLVARDRGAQPLEGSALLTLHVLDVNDNQPQIELIFLSDDGSPRVSEDAHPGEIVARVSVSDPDSSRGLQLGVTNSTLSLSGSEGDFGLASRDNVVYLLVVEKPLDRERCASYNLELEATDAGEPPLRASRAFRLVVTDVNDNPPRFLSERYVAHLLESVEPGSSVTRVRAEDADENENARVSYSLAPGNAISRWFAVEADTGLITTAARLDCETDPAPLIWIIASDAGKPQLSASASLRVIVHDLNDREPVFERPFYNVSVPESLPPGRCFVKVLAKDPDCGVNAIVNYTLAAGTNTKQFVVRSDTGDVCIAAALDRETVDYYELPVVATDRGGLSTTSIVQVLVNDVNDNRPIFDPREYNVTLKVNGPMNGSILRCAATDHDSGSYGHITYGISSGNEAGIFRIDRASGEIFVIQPNRLTKASIYLLNIFASDAGGLKSVVGALVRITTVGPGEHSVSCDKPRYIISIKENVARNTFIGSVRDSSVFFISGE